MELRCLSVFLAFRALWVLPTAPHKPGLEGTPVVPALGRQRQEDQEFKSSTDAEFKASLNT